MLKVNNLNVLRGNMQILWDVSINVEKGEIVSVIGANGAGKTTLLSTIAGLLKPLSGSIEFNGRRIDGLPPHRIVPLGIAFVPDDRKLFPHMTVRENLLLGAYSSKKKTSGKLFSVLKKRDKSKKETLRETLNMVYELFPVLKEREKQLAITLSGGEQRMLAIARGLMSNPELLILDEPSAGLSPKLTIEIFKAVGELRKHGLSILVAEQNVYYALKASDRAYVMETGKVTLHGEGKELLKNKYVKEAFLGI
ncbi:MAG: ABC transporter ATP-binding protein [Candidatus Bathyarchaeia archaeon]